MRKIVAIICSLLLFVSIVSGCSCSKNKASLAIGDMNAIRYVDIDFDELDSMTYNKDSFVLYFHRESCGHCQDFDPIINSVIKKRNLIIYSVDLDYVRMPSNHELRVLEGTPSLVVYKDGEILFKTDPNKNEKYFTSGEGFESFLDKYTYMPTMYYISRSDLRRKIDDDESFIIYYSDGECFDCKSMYNNYLRDFLDKNTDTKQFYVIETRSEGVRLTDGLANQEQWNEFKREYGLSKAGNSIFGYDVGYVPTVQFYNKGELRDMLVYLNDIRETVSDKEDGTKNIRIVDSYYKDNPFIGETMLNTEYKNKVSSFYNDKLEQFLNKNLPLVD